MGVLPGLSLFTTFPEGFTRKLSSSHPTKSRVQPCIVEKILERLDCKWLRDKQLARPPLKCLTTEIDFNTGRREITARHQKLAKRLIIFETVNIEACSAVPTDVNTRKVCLLGAD
jgi:hypothetical protein